jgi:hypothetical protein
VTKQPTQRQRMSTATRIRPRSAMKTAR